MVPSHKECLWILLSDELDDAERDRECIREDAVTDPLVGREIEIGFHAGDERLSERSGAVASAMFIGSGKAKVFTNVAIPHIDVLTILAEVESQSPRTETRCAKIAAL